MKFMQRAAASPASSSPATPTATPTPDSEQVSKRRKLSHKPTPSKTQASAAQIDQAAVQAALAEEERKRQEALVQRAAELGDEHWVLERPDKGTSPSREIQTPLNVVYVGFAQIDCSNDADLDAESIDSLPGYTSKIRRYNMPDKLASKHRTMKERDSESDDSGDSSSSSSSDSDSDSDADRRAGRHSYGKRPEPPRSDSPRTILQSKKSAEQAKAKQFAGQRRKKEIKLNSPKTPSSGGGLLSISSGGATPFRQNCHRCGKPGHKSAECKNSSLKRSAR